VNQQSPAATREGQTTTLTNGELVIRREFDAPRDLVWRAWTEADRLEKWWGPTGWSLEVRSLDLRPGGVFLYAMRADSNLMFGRFVYREVKPPEHLTWVTSFSDEHGGMTRAPFAAHFPLEVLSTLSLEERGRRTLLTLRGSPVNATEGERAFYEGMLSSMEAGYRGTFDQLDEHLAATP
jgi:uncharacterized protein YndB with AHSA1/START domain